MAPLALVILIHPKSVEKKERVLELLPGIVPTLRDPSAQCTTRTVFQPATRDKAALGLVPEGEKDTLLGVVEIWTGASALTNIQKTDGYKNFYGAVEKEALYVNDDITAWNPTAGFVTRKNEKESPKAGVVMLAKFICKDGEGNREGLVDVLSKYCDWVEENEPTTYTYSVLTRRKAPNEVLLFERYKDLPSIGLHAKTDQFKAMFKGTGRFIQGRKTVLSEFEELDGSFVSNTPGGAGPQAKL